MSERERVDLMVGPASSASSRLDSFRAAQLSQKQRDQRTIMLTSLVIWALAGAGIAYVFFRRVPWDRLGNTPA